MNCADRRYFHAWSSARSVLCLSQRSGAAAAAHSPWTYFDKTRGLAENTVQAIVPDGAGGLWVGTRGGLSRFDGARLADDNRRRRASRQRRAQPRSRGRATGSGSGRGPASAGSRAGAGAVWGSPARRRAGASRVVVVTDRAGVTWLGHAGGLLRFDRAGGVLEPVPEVAGPAGERASRRPGRAPLGRRRRRSLAAGGERLAAGVKEAAALPSGAVTALFEDTSGTIWCGGERGVAEFDGSSWRPARFGAEIPVAAVTGLTQDGEGRVWVGTQVGCGLLGRLRVALVHRALGVAGGRGPRAGRRSQRFDLDRHHAGTRPLRHHLVDPGRRRAREGSSPRAPLLRGRDGSLFIGAEQGFVVQRGASSRRSGRASVSRARVRCFRRGCGRATSGSGPTAAWCATTARCASSTSPR